MTDCGSAEKRQSSQWWTITVTFAEYSSDCDFEHSLVSSWPAEFGRFQGRGASCDQNAPAETPPAFEVSSKRRRGFPSETQVKRGERIVGGTKELIEKLGRNDLCVCVCGSGRRFQALLPADR